jgi:kynurenine formamidase
VSKEAWGRWGTDDEIGAPNFIGPAQRLTAAGLVTEGRVISLAQPLDRHTPVPSHRLGIGHFFDRDGGDYAVGARRPGGFQFAEDSVLLPTHSGTHIDALCHAWYDDLLYNGHSASGIRSGGAAHCGVEQLPPIVTRGVLVDLAGQEGVSSLAAGHRVTAAQLRQWFADQGMQPEPGDVALVRTGWYERVAELGSTFFDGEPGLDASAGVWLAESGVAAIGADNYAIEAIPFEEGTVFPLHQRLIRDFGVPLIEGLMLGELAASGRREFLFCAAALPISGGAGSPVHPFVVL